MIIKRKLKAPGHFIALIIFGGLILQSSSNEISFNRDIRPILSNKCFACHGPDENDRKSKLRLDRSDGPDGAYRTSDGITALKPGSLEESELWHRVITDDVDEIMPPPEAKKKALLNVFPLPHS